jgi:CRISPR locus-related DNA-binding protein
MGTVLISTIYKGSAVIMAIKEFFPDKVYFLVDDPIDDIRKNTINMIKDLFKEIKIEQISAKIYDIIDIAEKSVSVIKKESKNKVILHISEGRKTMSLGLLFSGYLMKDKIESIYYLMEENNHAIKLPLFSLKVSSKKRALLTEISRGTTSVDKLGKTLNILSSTLYVHLKELRDSGFITKDLNLTDMGKIVLLN